MFKSKSVMTLLVGLLTFILMVSVSGKAVAVVSREGNNCALTSSCTAVNSMKISDTTSKKIVFNATQSVQKMISQKALILHATKNALNFEETKILKLNKDDRIFNSVTIPFSKEGYSLLSNLTLVFDENFKLLGYSETIFSKNSEGNFNIRSYSEGSIAFDKDTTAKYLENSVIRENLDRAKTQKQLPQDSSTQKSHLQGNIYAKAACLSLILGIDAAVALILISVCSGSCVAPPTYPICAACIGAVAVVGAANIGGVIGCFNV